MLLLHAAMSRRESAGTSLPAARLPKHQSKPVRGERTMQTSRNGITEAAAEAQGTIAETAQTVRDTAADLGAKAGEYAREAGRQAGAAAQTAYSTGNDVRDMVEGFTRQNVWSSLLIAGAVGYGLACLVKNTRT
jgi:ElaB/YqjD/DUF883 family membrane-anchored ribosome-binding protein